MTYLHALVAEVDAISDEGVVGQLTKLSKPEESETILGRASPALLRLYALFAQAFEAANAKADEFNAAQQADERDVDLLEKLHEEHATLDKRLKTLNIRCQKMLPGTVSALMAISWPCPSRVAVGCTSSLST